MPKSQKYYQLIWCTNGLFKQIYFTNNIATIRFNKYSIISSLIMYSQIDNNTSQVLLCLHFWERTQYTKGGTQIGNVLIR